MTKNTCSDFTQDFKDAVMKRLGNPIVFTFLFSWCVVNWRFIAMLCFSKLAMAQRIEVIEEKYINWSNNFILPLVFALIYLFGMPWILAGYSWLSGFATNKRHKIECTQETIRIGQEKDLAHKQFDLTKIRTGNKSLEEMQQELRDTTAKLEQRDIDIKSLEQQQSIFNQEHEDLKKANESTARVKEEYRVRAAALEESYKALEKRESELLKEKQQLEEDLAVERGELEIISTEPQKEVNADPTEPLSDVFTLNTSTLSSDRLLSGAEKAIPDVLKNPKLFGAVSHIDHMTGEDFEQQELLNSLQGLSNPTGLMNTSWKDKKK